MNTRPNTATCDQTACSGIDELRHEREEEERRLRIEDVDDRASPEELSERPAADDHAGGRVPFEETPDSDYKY